MVFGELFVDDIDYNLVQVCAFYGSFAPHAAFVASYLFYHRICDQKRLFYKDLRSAVIELKLLKANP